MKREPTPKSRYFLAELVINCMLFVICASVCLSLFAQGFLDSSESRILSMATLQAQNTAECVKATSGDTDALAQLIGASVSGDLIVTYYDDEWKVTQSDTAPYKLTVELTDEDTLLLADIKVYDADSEVYDILVKQYIGNTGGVQLD